MRKGTTTVIRATREMENVSPVYGNERAGSLQVNPLRRLGRAPTSRRMHTAATVTKEKKMINAVNMES
jgi:hypothetical protein